MARYLIAASEAARPLLFFQSHRYALTIRQLIEKSLARENISKTKKILGEGFQEYLNYSAIFEDQHGPYSNSNHKMYLQRVSNAQIKELLKSYGSANEKSQSEIALLMTDPYFEAMHHPDNNSGIGIENCGTNMIQKGITAEQLKSVLSKKPGLDLNTRIVLDHNGEIKIQVMALNNSELDPEILAALRRTVAALREATRFALTEHQKNQLNYAIKYLEKGNIEDFRELNREWVRDRTDSKVDFVIGWTEVYNDHFSRMGTWETYVQILDDQTTLEAKKLAAVAPYFEEKMPYGPYKKTFPKDYAPPAILATWFHEIGDSHPSGFNLPNFDDIRIETGAKNSIRVRPPQERKNPTSVALKPANITEFSSESDRQALLENFWDAAKYSRTSS